MKRIISMFALIALVSPAGAAVDEGTVAAIDGKGGFQVTTMRNGIMNFQASKDIMRRQPAFKLPSWPNVYRDLQNGDHIEFTWGKNEKTGNAIATGFRVIKRGG